MKIRINHYHNLHRTEERLRDVSRGLGKDVTFHVYPGTGHAFTNEENPLGTYDQAATATSWGRAIALLGTVS